jgi:hypothetical protein
VATSSSYFRFFLILATLIASWFGMQQVHELGHVLGAWLTGGQVERVVLPIVGFSRTDLAANPRPLVVAWSGPAFGAMAPLMAWLAAAAIRMPVAFVLRFFAGFCLVANGLYLGVGAFDKVGDCGDLLRHGAQTWQLWLFGLATAPAGLWLWHGLGPKFGLGANAQPVSRQHIFGLVIVSSVLVAIALLIGGE